MFNKGGLLSFLLKPTKFQELFGRENIPEKVIS